jgi:hypothetical protein
VTGVQTCALPIYQRVFAGGVALPAAQKAPVNLEGVEILKFQDMNNEIVINLISDKPFDGWVFPTRYPVPANPGVSSGAFYQSTCVAPLYKIRLGPGESWTLSFSVKFTH